MLSTPTRRKPGRPRPSESDRLRREAIVGRYRLGDRSAREICDAFGIHPSTLHRWDRELAAAN